MITIDFNGKNSYDDFGATMTPNRVIGRPSKEKKKRKPAYSNHEHDFSRLYGSETYTNRSLTYSFNLLEKSKVNLSYRMTEFVNWLMNSNGRQPLKDSAIPGYYFLAEVEEATDIEENWIDGVVTVNFVAYPFMIKEVAEGSPYWDDYTILDVYQDTTFEVNDSKTVNLINNGTPAIKPEITASSEMVITKNNRSYTISEGASKNYRLALDSGDNELSIEGNGSITFLWHKEVI